MSPRSADITVSGVITLGVVDHRHKLRDRPSTPPAPHKKNTTCFTFDGLHAYAFGCHDVFTGLPGDYWHLKLFYKLYGVYSFKYNCPIFHVRPWERVFEVEIW